MFSLLAIFLLEVIFAVLPSYIGSITTLVARLVFKVTDKEMNTREEIKRLKEEQAQLSVTDEFVQYAKLQRQIDKHMSLIKEKGSTRKQHVYYLRLGITVGMYVLHALIVLSLMYMFRSSPLLTLPESWVAPLSKIVAFPTGIPGAVGLGWWLLVSNSVIYRAKTLVKLW